MPLVSVNRRFALVLAIGMASGVLSRGAAACPFCLGSQQLTLRERIETPDASVLVQWQSGEPGNLDRDVPDTTTFHVLQVWKGEFAAEQTLTIDRYQEGRAGELFLLIGTKLEEAIRWDRAIPLSQTALAYLESLPSSEASIGERLRHAFRHLESDDTTIANDAFTVLASAKYEDIADQRSHLVVADLRNWIHNPATHVTRLGVYGMLLGLAGASEDIPGLRQKIFAENQDQEIRIGIDGVIAGFLLLAGTEGLNELDHAYLHSSGARPDDLNAVTSALRFQWEYGDELIPKDRLRQSMRLGLNHEPIRDLTITDLARWQDWSVTDRLIELYQDEETDTFVRRSIIRFLMTAAAASTEGLSPDELSAVQQAQESVETIRTADPSLYKRAARGFVHPTTSQWKPPQSGLGFRPNCLCLSSWGC